MLGLKVGFYTLGCKVSQYETEAIAEQFEKCGFVVSKFSDKCHVYVINTCTVTAESDRKCRQIIRRAKRNNPEGIVIALGCYSQRSPEEVAKIEGVDCILGSANKLSAVECAKRILAGKEAFPVGRVGVTDINKEPFEKMNITKGERTRVYVKIEDGCQSRCTYCAIPSARGRVRSKAREDVISEVEALSKSGIREIVLTGIETGSYGADFEDGYSLADLLEELDSRGSAYRIRLGSLAPELVGESFAKRVSSLRSLAPHFHISVQSGSDKVLRDMKRRYTSSMALENIKRLKALIPCANFTTDLMVGFPGESEDDFERTKDFLIEARFLDCHVFAYSKRKNTPAAEFENQIPEDIKRKRSEELIALAASVRDDLLSETVNLGAPLSAILETRKGDRWYGHTDSFVQVAVDGLKGNGLHGEVMLVHPVSHKDGIVFCVPHEVV